MANSTTHSQLPPIYGAAYNISLGFRKSDGTSLAPTSLDSEISQNCGTFADCTNEVTLAKEVGGSTDSALGYITLTYSEMSADDLLLQVKSSNCVTALLNIRPKKLNPIRTGTAQAGANGTITLDSSASSNDDFYNGMIIRTDSGTGIGQARMITDYVGSTKVASVYPNWETNPSSDTTFTVGTFVSDSVNSQNLDVAVSTRLSTSGYTAPSNSDITAIKAKTDNLPSSPAAVGSNMGTVTSVTNAVTVGTNNDKTGYSLTVTPPTSSDIATAVWAASTRTLSSFGTLIADIWEYTTRTLSAFSFTPTPSNASDVTAIKAKTDNLPSSPAAVGSAMTLTSDYDAAKTAAQVGSNMGSVTSVTNPVTVGTNNDKTGYTATVSDKTGFSLTSSYDSAKTASSQTSVDSIDLLIDAIKSVSDKLDTMLELYDSSTYKFTDTAIPSGGGSGGEVTVSDITSEALAKFATVDTGETGSVSGSVVDLVKSANTGSDIINYSYEVFDGNNNPISNVQVWFYTDSSMTNLVQYGVTDTFGITVVQVSPGTYYVRRYHPDYTFTVPVEEVVS